MPNSKHRTVLHLHGEHSDVQQRYVSYFREPDDESDVPPALHLSQDVYEDMGSPETITLTVEPGDLLNRGDAVAKGTVDAHSVKDSLGTPKDEALPGLED